MVKLDATGKQPSKAGRTVYAPGRSQPGPSDEPGTADEPLIGPQSEAFYGGGKATDKKYKEGSYTYVLIGACLVGIVIFMR